MGEKDAGLDSETAGEPVAAEGVAACEELAKVLEAVATVALSVDVAVGSAEMMEVVQQGTAEELMGTSAEMPAMAADQVAEGEMMATATVVAAAGAGATEEKAILRIRWAVLCRRTCCRSRFHLATSPCSLRCLASRLALYPRPGVRSN